MLDHLTTTRKHSGPRTATGLAVSITLHALLGALLLYGVGTAGSELRNPPSSSDTTVAVSESDLHGIGGPLEETRWAVPTLDIRAAALAPGVSPNLPDTLELGRAVPIRFVLPAERIAPDSLMQVETASGARVEMRLSHTWQATLNGRRFMVEALTPELQVADKSRPTEWLWNVTPTEAGTQSLSLRLDAVASVDGFERVVTLATLPSTVVVRATAIQRATRFFSHHWTWLSALTLVALTGWLRAVLVQRALLA